MFTKPKNGWVNLEIGDFRERASYLTDIPNDCLDTFIFALQNNIPASVYFDAEGWDYYLISSFYRTFIIINKEKPELFTFEKDYEEIAKELIIDFEENIDEWVNWECWHGKSEEEFKENKVNLITKINKLKSLIE